MQFSRENAIKVIIILLVILMVITLLTIVNKRILYKYISKESIISNDLHVVFKQFCIQENSEIPLIVYSKSFWYRPLTNTLGVKNLNSNYLVDAFAFLHELYHLKDRKRLLRIQPVVSIYSYVVSSLMKLLALYSIWFEKNVSFLESSLLIDIGLLLICFFLTVLVETYASKGALYFLEENQYIEETEFVESISFHSTMTYCFQYAAYITLSIILFFLLQLKYPEYSRHLSYFYKFSI